MTISHEKPKTQPNTLYSEGICILMQMQSGNLWTVGKCIGKQSNYIEKLDISKVK
jgi:hypothetical protein